MTSEELLIGQIINRPELLYELDLSPHHFLNARVRKVFEVIEEIQSSGDEVDLVTVNTMTPNIEAAWIASLTDQVTPNVKLLTDTVKDDTRRHNLKRIGQELAERSEQSGGFAVMEWLERQLSDLSMTTGDDLAVVGQDVMNMVNEFERRYKAKGEIPGIRCGLQKLDNVTLGWNKQRYIVIGGRPSEGKSALLLNFALNSASAGHPVGLISLESSRTEVEERAFSNLGNIDGHNLRTGLLKPAEFKGLTEAAGVLQNMPLYIADKPNMSLAEVKTRCRRMVRQYGVELLLVDYVQLVQMDGAMSDFERVSAVSVALKNLSRELEIPLIVAAQLNRNSQEGRTRRPRLSDFKSSGQIEQDADIAILIDGDWLLVEKNRDGITGDIPIEFDKAHMRFAEKQGDF